MLIGMDVAGRLTGVIVDRHTEPYGDFSIEPPQFAITIRAAAREVRDSARTRVTSFMCAPTAQSPLFIFLHSD